MTKSNRPSSPSYLKALSSDPPAPKKHSKLSLQRRSKRRKDLTVLPPTEPPTDIIAAPPSKPDPIVTVTPIAKAASKSTPADPAPKMPSLNSPPPKEVSSPSPAKKHAPERYIEPYARVWGVVHKRRPDYSVAEEKQRGTVVRAVGKSMWMVEFDNDDKSYQHKHSNALTLLTADELEEEREHTHSEEEQILEDFVKTHFSPPNNDEVIDRTIDFSKADNKLKASSRKDNEKKSDSRATRSRKSARIAEKTKKEDDVPSAGEAKKTKRPTAKSEKKKAQDDYADMPLPVKLTKKQREKKIENEVKRKATMTESEIETEFAEKLKDGQESIDSNIGKSVLLVNSENKNDSILWVQVKDHKVDPSNMVQPRPKSDLGLKSLRLREFLWRSCSLPLANLYMHLSYKDGDCTALLKRMNELVDEDNAQKIQASDMSIKVTTRDMYTHARPEGDDDSDDDGELIMHPTSPTRKRYKPRTVASFSLQEMLKFHALVIAASETNKQGHKNWLSEEEDGVAEWKTLVKGFDFGEELSLTRFKEIKRYFIRAWECHELREAGDPWWRIQKLLTEFNEVRKHTVLHSTSRVFDESMSLWRPRASPRGNLPHLSSIARKPGGGIGTELKDCGDPELVTLSYAEFQRSVLQAQQLEHAGTLIPTAACSLRMADGCSQSHEDGKTEIFFGDAWFGNISTVRALLQSQKVDGVKRECCFTIKGGSRLFPKRALECLLANKPGGCHAVFKGYDPVSDRKLVAVGWKFNTGKVLTFLATDGINSTLPSPNPYKIRFSDEYGNLRFQEIPRPKLVEQHFTALYRQYYGGS